MLVETKEKPAFGGETTAGRKIDLAYGDICKSFRKSEGWTQAQMANLFDITAPTYWRYENNQQTPDLGNVLIAMKRPGFPPELAFQITALVAGRFCQVYRHEAVELPTGIIDQAHGLRRLVIGLQVAATEALIEVDQATSGDSIEMNKPERAVSAVAHCLEIGKQLLSQLAAMCRRPVRRF